MIRVPDEDVQQLVLEKGEQYWRSELKKAQTAVLIYFGVLVIAVVIVFIRGNGSNIIENDGSFLSILPWVLVMCATIFVGASQVRLLPFMNSVLAVHWIIVSIFAVVGCGAPLWLIMFAGSNSVAKRRLDLAVASID